MNKNNISTIFIWILLIALLISSITFIIQFINDLTEILVAIIGGSVAITSAILTHALSDIRVQKERILLEKQKNYIEIIDNIAVLIRDGGDDNFSTVHLKSWIFACPEVVYQTQRLMDLKQKLINTQNQTQNDPLLKAEELVRNMRATLEDLLKYMREDLGLEQIEINELSNNLFRVKGYM